VSQFPAIRLYKSEENPLQKDLLYPKAEQKTAGVLGFIFKDNLSIFPLF
jgi:hypothetical protein